MKVLAAFQILIVLASAEFSAPSLGRVNEIKDALITQFRNNRNFIPTALRLGMNTNISTTTYYIMTFKI